MTFSSYASILTGKHPHEPGVKKDWDSFPAGQPSLPLALREHGWNECEELIWFKPNSPPLGSKLRPRRAWESVLWFGKSSQPYSDLKACGKESDRMGFAGSPRFAEGGTSEKTGWHPCVESFGYGSGIARITDVIVAPVGSEETGVDHPAVFPVSLAEPLIRTFSQEGDTVLDPFCGSGQTLLAAKACGRDYLGFDQDERYVPIAQDRLGRGNPPPTPSPSPHPRGVATRRARRGA
jgi:DNA modification methylase